MGFYGATAALSAADGTVESTALGSNTITLPTCLGKPNWVNNVRTFLVCYNNNTTGTAFDTPSGWTLLGAQSLALPGGPIAMFYRDYQAGDPTSVTLTGNGNINTNGGSTAILCLSVRSDHSMSVVSDQLDTTNASVASANGHFQSFPPTNVGNLRLAFIVNTLGTGGSRISSAPAVTASDKNPSSQIFRATDTRVLNGGLSIDVWWSVWEDPSGLDANAANFPLTQSCKSITRAIVLDDGSSALESAIETELFEIQPDPVAYSMEVAAVDEVSADARWWGGGTNTLGDAD